MDQNQKGRQNRVWTTDGNITPLEFSNLATFENGYRSIKNGGTVEAKEFGDIRNDIKIEKGLLVDDNTPTLHLTFKRDREIVKSDAGRTPIIASGCLNAAVAGSPSSDELKIYNAITCSIYPTGSKKGESAYPYRHPWLSFKIKFTSKSADECFAQMRWPLEPDKINRVCIEIPELFGTTGDKGLENCDLLIMTENHGARTKDSAESVFYIWNLQFERVDPKVHIGWEPTSSTISLSHVGYKPDSRKVASFNPKAVTAGTPEDVKCRMAPLDGADEESFPLDFKGACRIVGSPGGKQITTYDFSDFKNPGTYIFEVLSDANGAEPLRSSPFTISEDIFCTVVDTELDFLSKIRCGMPGGTGWHDKCHRDDGVLVELKSCKVKKDTDNNKSIVIIDEKDEKEIDKKDLLQLCKDCTNKNKDICEDSDKWVCTIPVLKDEGGHHDFSGGYHDAGDYRKSVENEVRILKGLVYAAQRLNLFLEKSKKIQALIVAEMKWALQSILKHMETDKKNNYSGKIVEGIIMSSGRNPYYDDGSCPKELIKIFWTRNTLWTDGKCDGYDDRALSLKPIISGGYDYNILNIIFALAGAANVLKKVNLTKLAKKSFNAANRIFSNLTGNKNEDEEGSFYKDITYTLDVTLYAMSALQLYEYLEPGEEKKYFEELSKNCLNKIVDEHRATDIFVGEGNGGKGELEFTNFFLDDPGNSIYKTGTPFTFLFGHLLQVQRYQDANPATALAMGCAIFRNDEKSFKKWKDALIEWKNGWLVPSAEETDPYGIVVEGIYSDVFEEKNIDGKNSKPLRVDANKTAVDFFMQRSPNTGLVQIGTAIAAGLAAHVFKTIDPQEADAFMTHAENQLQFLLGNNPCNLCFSYNLKGDKNSNPIEDGIYPIYTAWADGIAPGGLSIVYGVSESDEPTYSPNGFMELKNAFPARELCNYFAAYVLAAAAQVDCYSSAIDKKDQPRPQFTKLSRFRPAESYTKVEDEKDEPVEKEVDSAEPQT